MELDRDLQSIQETRNLIKAARKAEDMLSTFSQEQIDKIVDALRAAGEENACYLAEMAVSETGMGNYEDKCFKNYFASKYLYDSIKDMKTAGIINEDKQNKLLEIAEPMGVVAGIVPTTNPTSTVIYKSMVSLKSRNTIVFSPHPTAVKCTCEAARIMHDAAVKAGAPQGCIGCISTVSLGATNELMSNKDTACIIATGGTGLVKAAYSSGKPAFGVGPGNVPVFVEESADIVKAAEFIVTGKTFDNGTICASEQSIVAMENIADELIGYLKKNGAYFLSPDEVEKVSKTCILPNNGMNPKAVGRSALAIAEMAGVSVPQSTRCLVAPLAGVGKGFALSHEKLMPVLAFYKVPDWKSGCDLCIRLLEAGGIGHSLAIHSNNEQIIREFALKKPVFRIIVNTPSTFGGIGATTALAPALTLGCGTWGGSSISDNLTPLHLMNKKRVVWPVREPQRPPVKPLQGTLAGTAVHNSCKRESAQINGDLIDNIVNQVMKALNKQ